MLPIAEQYLKSLCELKTPDDKMIATGILSDLKEDTLQICSDAEVLPTLHCGTLVKINVCHPVLEMKVLIGKVYTSAPELIQVANIQNLTDFERRNFFRLKLSIHTQAYPLKDDELTKQPVQLFQICVTDLSLSGCFVKTKRNLAIGDRFTVALPLIDARVSFECQVQRFEKPNGKLNGYGCAFLNNSNRQFDQLCQFIFEKQREQIRKSRNDLY
jgi:hypothetical protein